MSKRKLKTRTVTVEHRSLPTPERLAKADGHFEVGGDDRSGSVYTFKDDSLDRALKREIITGRQYAALHKFRHHWYHGGVAPTVGSIDLNRVFSSDHGSYGTMPASERQAFHRGQYRKAVQQLGIRMSMIVEKFVCLDQPIVAVGHALGWAHPMQARAAATALLVEAADKLADLWKGANGA